MKLYRKIIVGQLLKSFLVVGFIFLNASSFSQKVLLDSLTLDTMRAYTSIEEALRNPDLVIKLELRKKKLKEFPKKILQLKNLQYLDLSKNYIKEIPDEISQLNNLQYFSMSKNGLEMIPKQIGDLNQLYYLNFNQNDIGGLPPQIGKLVLLRNLDLWSNNITTFPEEIRNMKNLKLLDLRVILIPDNEQSRIQSLLPNTLVYFSPYCKCAQ